MSTAFPFTVTAYSYFFTVVSVRAVLPMRISHSVAGSLSVTTGSFTPVMLHRYAQRYEAKRVTVMSAFAGTTMR